MAAIPDSITLSFGEKGGNDAEFPPQPGFLSLFLTSVYFTPTTFTSVLSFSLAI